MDDFEARLKSLPLRQPSPALDHRVLSQEVQVVAVEPCRSRWMVPLWVAVGMSAAVGCAGFLGGLAVRADRPTTTSSTAEEPAPVTTEVLCQSPGGRNPFDLTQFPEPLLRGNPVVTIRTTKGT
jgi:hypothetical protein